MPCHDHYPSQEETEALHRANLNARVACDAIRILVQHGLVAGLSEESQQWWGRHLAYDKLRLDEKERRREERKERLRRTISDLRREAKNLQNELEGIEKGLRD